MKAVAVFPKQKYSAHMIDEPIPKISNTFPPTKVGGFSATEPVLPD